MMSTGPKAPPKNCDAAGSATDAADTKTYTMGAAPRAGDLRLHLNEFRFNHAAGVLDVTRKLAADEKTLIEYVTGPPASLVAAIGKYVGVPDDHVFVAAGSDDVLRAIIGACARLGIAGAVGGVPTYTHFIHFVEQAGLRWRPVVMGVQEPEAVRAGLVELHAEVLRRGALVYLVSPNNPTGDLWRRDTVAAWAARYPKSVFLVDEAYTEFVKDASLVSLTATCENVVIARTFSKAFGLAGLRIGYGVASPALAKRIGAFVNPKAVTALASACAEACLGHVAHYRERAVVAVQQRDELAAALRAAGWHVRSSEGNFLLVFGARVDALRAAGVHVRDRSDLPGLHGWARITAGSPADTKAVLGAIGSPPTPGPVPHTPKSVIARLRAYLTLAAPILTEHKVRWWACDGTLLGAMRHKGIIPWDNDIDLGYVFDESGVDPAARLVSAFATVGLTLQRNRTNAYWQIGVDLPKNPTGPVHECIDLFPYHLGEGGAYLNADPRFRHETSTGSDCNTRYAPEELFPLRTSEFYDGSIPVPAKAEAVLARAAGDKWFTDATVEVDKNIIRFPIVDYSPA